jgi:hypothetical protein
MRVEETWVRSAVDTPKSQAGQRTIALGARVAAELFEHRGRSAFSGEDKRVFANPRTGRPFNATRYAALVRRALKRAGIGEHVRRRTICGTRRSRTRPLRYASGGVDDQGGAFVVCDDKAVHRPRG